LPPAEPRLVLGTAGHIDHGKTALIRALTGVDTDRLPEEKARGITIDLGFAPLDLAGGLRVGVVDVPGHERLVRTMVAGATGIDVVLLVVAADEGVMPQTREHVAICELLGVTSGVVALTKIDIASDDLAELAEAEVEDFLGGTCLTGSPIVRVSAVSGEGLDALRGKLSTQIETATARTPRSGPPRLSIDRVFAARGFGAVVTGTLVGAALAVGDAVEVQPSARPARVRGLQRHGTAAERVEPGARCAVNLQGIELGDISRGQVVTRPGALTPTLTLDVELVWLDVAPRSKQSVSVELLAGTAERRARVIPVGSDALEPGKAGFARLHVEGEPVPLLPGDRFVLRGFARTAMGGTTLGGGRVLDVAPPRRRRSDPGLLRDLQALAQREPHGDLAVRIRRAGLSGATHEALRRETGLDEGTLDRSLEALRESGAALPTSGGVWLDSSALDNLEKRLEAALDAWHAAEPLLPGMPAGTLRGRVPANVPRAAAELALVRLAERGALCIEGDLVRRPDHRPKLGAEQRALVERILDEATSAGLDPPGLREWAERLETPLERLRDLLAHLEREGRLVRAGEDLWFDRTAIDALRERIVAHLREHGRLETPAYKALIGTTRRTAVPLMELFDEQRLTMRKGDARLLRKPGGRV
jgi:selenocysteine-specific elongation factor